MRDRELGQAGYVTSNRKSQVVEQKGSIYWVKRKYIGYELLK